MEEQDTETDVERFSIDYENEQKYEYDDSRYTGTVVRVRVDEFKNGGTVGVHHYDEDGSRLSYHRFKINNLDRRALVYPNADEETALSDAVQRALHAGGWTIANLHDMRIMPEEDDPFEVQFLDLRDHFDSLAEQADSMYMRALYEAQRRLIEHIGSLQAIVTMAKENGRDPDDVFEQGIGPIAEMQPNRPRDTFTPETYVQGVFSATLDADAEWRKGPQERVISLLEGARMYYRMGFDYDQALTLTAKDQGITVDDIV